MRNTETFFAGRCEFRTDLCVCYILYVDQWKFRFSMSSDRREGGPRSSIDLVRHVRSSGFNTMVAPLTNKPTRTAELLTRVSSTIPLSCEEDTELRKWPLSRYCCVSCILETKTKVGITEVKPPVLRTFCLFICLFIYSGINKGEGQRGKKMSH